MKARDDDSPTLEGRQLWCSFGDGETKATVLHDVSVELFAGQITLLMGPSGSGKSTLLAVLSGLLRPDGGQVLALGRDLWAMPDHDRERLPPALTAASSSRVTTCSRP